MTDSAAKAQEGKATTIKKTFSRQTSVSITINAEPATVWGLLTNATEHVRWNSTVVSIEGEIKPGEQIALVSTLDPKRTFKLNVKEFEPHKRLVWGDSMGNRAYLIEENASGQLTFSIDEKIGGPIFPLFSRAIPSFEESFEQIAADLKKEAENK